MSTLDGGITNIALPVLLRVGAATHGGPAEISRAAPGEIVAGLSWTFRFAAAVLLVSSALAAGAWRADRGSSRKPAW
jgi:hypothetical protein